MDLAFLQGYKRAQLWTPMKPHLPAGHRRPHTHCAHLWCSAHLCSICLYYKQQEPSDPPQPYFQLRTFQQAPLALRLPTPEKFHVAGPPRFLTNWSGRSLGPRIS